MRKKGLGGVQEFAGEEKVSTALRTVTNRTFLGCYIIGV
jgi:hypothetical protein